MPPECLACFPGDAALCTACLPHGYPMMYLKVRDAKAAELVAKGFAALPASQPTPAPVKGQKK